MSVYICIYIYIWNPYYAFTIHKHILPVHAYTHASITMFVLALVYVYVYTHTHEQAYKLMAMKTMMMLTPARMMKKICVHCIFACVRLAHEHMCLCAKVTALFIQALLGHYVISIAVSEHICTHAHVWVHRCSGILTAQQYMCLSCTTK